MEDNARIEWDRRYDEGSHQSLRPDPFFVSAYDQFVARNLKHVGRALDLAGGVGRHALYLAERGWVVTLMDISEVALQQARRLAEEREVHISTEHVDLSEAQLPVSAYDLIVVFFYLERPLLPQLAAALRPGGFLIYKTYTREQIKLGGGPSHPMHLLEPDELLNAFPGLRVLHYRETTKGKAVAELVAKKE
jgi:SAM-dependent methyltransferase